MNILIMPVEYGWWLTTECLLGYEEQQYRLMVPRRLWFLRYSGAIFGQATRFTIIDIKFKK